MKFGDSFGEETYYGPLINERQFKKVLDYISYGIENEKLSLIHGGKERMFEKGYYVKPTVFRDVPDTSKLVKEEIFGPCLCILKPFKNLKEAIARANDTEYGLAAGIFSKDPSACELFVRSVSAGTIWINNYNYVRYNIPFGGFGVSGFGRDNGPEAILEYTTLKSVYYKHDFKKYDQELVNEIID